MDNNTNSRETMELLQYRIDDKYGRIYPGDPLRWIYPEYEVESIIANCTLNVTTCIKTYDLYEFWNELSEANRVLFFTCVFFNEFRLMILEDACLPDMEKFAETIKEYAAFKQMLINSFCNIDIFSKGAVADNTAWAKLHDVMTVRLKDEIERRKTKIK